MPVKFPEGPPKSLTYEKGKLAPGQGVNNPLPDKDLYLDFTAPMGKCSTVFFGLLFQLPKWGFERVKVEQAIDVSPVFTEYYQKTMRQKEELEVKIKNSLISISKALSDLELLKHDLRKYKEFMDYYRMIDEGKKRGDEKLVRKGEQSLKSVFIDQVDVHTDLPNTPIALRSIVVRWPTIIADFMKLKDEDIDPREIAKKYRVSEAEAVVLANKNRLYQEWRDELFRRAVEERFHSLVRLVEARKKSYEEYKEMIRPTLRRYKAIVDGIGKLGLERAAFWRPDAHAMSIDYSLVWAWKPFVPPEKYKPTRYVPLSEIPAEKAGFTREEVKKLIELGLTDGNVKALPVEPSIDSVVRENVGKIESEYNVTITISDVFNAREKLVSRYEKSEKGVTDYESWPFSPYFFFYEIPIIRAVLRLPNGAEVENMMINRLKAYVISQNILILRYLELIAIDKQLDNYIKQMLGEMGSKEGKAVSIEEIEKEYLIKLGEEKKEKEKSKGGVRIGSFLENLGLKFMFFRARGPYEFSFAERLTKYYFKESAIEFGRIVDFLKNSFEVP